VTLSAFLGELSLPLNRNSCQGPCMETKYKHQLHHQIAPGPSFFFSKPLDTAHMSQASKAFRCNSTAILMILTL